MRQHFVGPCLCHVAHGSSFLAQGLLFHRCSAAGLTASRMLADDLVVPHDSSICFVLAIDDVMLFTRGDKRLQERALTRLDQSIADGGIVRNEKKDENRVLNATSVGVDFCNSTAIVPNTGKLENVISGLC